MAGNAVVSPTTAGGIDGRFTAPKQPELSSHFPGGPPAKCWFFGHSKLLREHYGHEDKINGGESAGVRLPTRGNQRGDEWVRKEKVEVEESRSKQQEELDREYQAETKRRHDVDARDTEARLMELDKEVFQEV